MSAVKERLLKYIKSIEMPISEFEKKIGVSNGYINSISKSIQPDKLENISKNFPDLSIKWLLLGEGNMSREVSRSLYKKELQNTIYADLIKSFPKEFVDNANLYHLANLYEMEGITVSQENNNPSNLLSDTSEKKDTRPRVPLTAAAGSLSEAERGVTLEECEQMPVITQLPSYDFTMFIKGDSMSPKYESGDEVACRWIDHSRFIQWGKIHVLDTIQGIIVKKIYDDGEKIRCVSINPNYPAFSIPKEDIHSMSLVVGSLSILEM